MDYLELYAFSNLYISRKTECNEDVFILPAKYPNKESYRVKVQNDFQEAKRSVMQRISEGKMTQEAGKSCFGVKKAIMMISNNTEDFLKMKQLKKNLND